MPQARERVRWEPQTVPDLEGTLIVWESTANGAEGYFYELYFEAKDTDNPANRMDAVFVAWYEHQEYQVPPLSEDQLFHVEQSLNEEEERLLECKYFTRKVGWTKVSMEQIVWRRNTLVDKCGGSLDDFHEQYPSTDMEAFLSSGRPVFSAEKLIEREADTRDAVWYGDVFDPKYEAKEVPDQPTSLSVLTEDPRPVAPARKRRDWPERTAPLLEPISESENLLESWGPTIEEEGKRYDGDRDPEWTDA